VLSHVAIRARNQKVLLASCDDDKLLAELRGKSGSRLKLSLSPSGDVTWTAAGKGEGVAAKGDTSGAKGKLTVKRPPPPPALVLPLAKFEAHRPSIGGKSFHLSELNPKSGSYQVPPSATVPFGMFEDVLKDPMNDDVREQLEDLVEDGEWAQVRSLVTEELALPPKLEAAVVEQMKTVGAPLPAAAAPWQKALKAVWASKWTDRAVSSRRQMGVHDDDLKLAVLCQPLAFASYAFVIHTRSPMANASKEDALVEVVVGLGESLVSNSPGRALSASVGPSDSAIQVHTFPSKPTGVFTPEEGTHIFRSDSNGEDLEGFAGAGLYDSITVLECPHRPVAYAEEPLIFDAAFRGKLLRRLFDLGRAVEANFRGQPQDIEGAVLKDGSLVVLQSRPQV